MNSTLIQHIYMTSNIFQRKIITVHTNINCNIDVVKTKKTFVVGYVFKSPCCSISERF